MKIQIKTTTINENTKIEYKELTNLVCKTSLCQVLKNHYKDQGDFYEKVFEVSREDAELAGWNPENTNFDYSRTNYCEGWRNFLKVRGKIDKEEKIITVDIKELLFEKK